MDIQQTVNTHIMDAVGPYLRRFIIANTTLHLLQLLSLRLTVYDAEYHHL